MKAVVVYDSYYGNTKTVAEAIAEELEAEGCEAELRCVRDRESSPPQGDILFLGSPVRMGSVTGRMKRYAKNLDPGEWRDKPLIVFTTILELPENPTDDQRQSHEKYDLGAGRKLRDLARSRGIDAAEDHLAVGVQGMKGPLIEHGVAQAREFTHDVLLVAAR
jgi:multimeric flavodoxin WrbA